MGVDGFDGLAQGVRGQSGVSKGQDICSDGSFTGENCNGIVTETNACLELNDAEDGIVRVCDQALTRSEKGRIVQHGDSGGPVYNRNVLEGDPHTVVALGIISGGSENGLHMNFTQCDRVSEAYSCHVAIGVP